MYIDLVDEKRLLKYSIYYLSRFDSSKKNLINILKKKIFNSNINSFEKKELINQIKKIILVLEENNLINDSRYCNTKVLSLKRSGKSKNYIVNYLLNKGISKQIIQTNLNLLLEKDKNWELDSAKLFAKKKKLFDSKTSYEKRLAKMARAGFSYDICKKILS